MPLAREVKAAVLVVLDERSASVSTWLAAPPVGPVVPIESIVPIWPAMSVGLVVECVDPVGPVTSVGLIDCVWPAGIVEFSVKISIIWWKAVNPLSTFIV